MDVAWQRYVDLVADFTRVTQKGAEHVVRALVRRGEVEASRGEKVVESLINRADQNRKAISSMVRSELCRTVNRLGLAQQADIDRLQASIARLEATIRNLGSNALAGESPLTSSADEPQALNPSQAGEGDRRD